VEIVTYRPEYRAAFESLNRAWLDAHSLLEQADLDYLQHPEELILASGGQLFFALQAGTVVGTCAAIRASECEFELAKLAVAAPAQGLGIGVASVRLALRQRSRPVTVGATREYLNRRP